MQNYRELRRVGRHSYSVTVHQLENLIQLSKAFAKADDDITPAFVIEAYHLLRQSIISVEKDDVKVEDDDDTARTEKRRRQTSSAPVTAAVQGGVAEILHAPSGEGVAGAPTATGWSGRTKTTYDKYMTVLTELVGRDNEDESNMSEGIEENRAGHRRFRAAACHCVAWVCRRCWPALSRAACCRVAYGRSSTCTCAYGDLTT